MSLQNLNSQERIQLNRLLGNYKLTPMTLAMKLNPLIIPAPFLMYISVIIASAIKKGNGRLIISLPPRHGKSELITKNTPIWVLENFHRMNVVVCSYGSTLSTDFGRAVRDLVKDNQNNLDIRIRRDAERADNWLTNLGGQMMSVGLGGPITGRGANVLIIDDYIKEIKDAQSQHQRDYIWDWFVTTAFTRLEPNATCIIVATRWHHDDLIGRILKHKPGRHPWQNIVIPALAEPTDWDSQTAIPADWADFIGRHYGEPLFKERFDKDELLDRKATLGSFFFNALYQQKPEADFGQLTDRRWFKYISAAPQSNSLKLVRVWDLAASEDEGDYVVGTLMAYDFQKDFTYILDIKREQLGPGGVETLLKATAEADGKGIPIIIEREPGSSGKLLVHNYANQLLKGWTVIEWPANDQKIVRAQPFLAAVESGRVALLDAPWNNTFLDEYDEFPGVEHDDQIDTCSAGFTYLTGKKMLRASWGREAGTQDVNNSGLVRASPTEIIMPNGKRYTMSQGYINSGHKRNGASWGR